MVELHKPRRTVHGQRYYTHEVIAGEIRLRSVPESWNCGWRRNFWSSLEQAWGLVQLRQRPRGHYDVPGRKHARPSYLRKALDHLQYFFWTRQWALALYAVDRRTYVGGARAHSPIVILSGFCPWLKYQKFGMYLEMYGHLHVQFLDHCSSHWPRYPLSEISLLHPSATWPQSVSTGLERLYSEASIAFWVCHLSSALMMQSSLHQLGVWKLCNSYEVPRSHVGAPESRDIRDFAP